MTLHSSAQLRVLHHCAVQLQPRKGCSLRTHTDLSKCSTVTSSSLRSLILHARSPLMITSHLAQSNVPQKSEEWFELRKNKLTTSTFSTALGFWKGKRRSELWQEKVYPNVEAVAVGQTAAMDWGVVNESAAIKGYINITGRAVSFLGFATHTQEGFKWLGASPDGLLGSYPGGGILEVKCPYNKGKPEVGNPWLTMPFYYMPQVQGQMEILDRDWVDLYCWTPKGSTIFRVCRDPSYWNLIKGILQEFWWENVIPAKELMLLGREEDMKAYVPSSVHRETGYVVRESIKLAAAAKLLCREISGQVEHYN